jgi:hypothetical protein
VLRVAIRAVTQFKGSVLFGRGSHITVREILEEFWRQEDGEMEKIEHEAFREDIQKILRGQE